MELPFGTCLGWLGDTGCDNLRCQTSIAADIQKGAYGTVVVTDEVQVRLVQADDAIARCEAALVAADQAIKHAYCRSVACCQNHLVEPAGGAISEEGSIFSEALNARSGHYRTIANGVDQTESDHRLFL
jgi:hypothetical protein